MLMATREWIAKVEKTKHYNFFYLTFLSIIFAVDDLKKPLNYCSNVAQADAISSNKSTRGW